MKRRFQVRFQEEQSEPYLIKSGVPQGSVLGRILYQIYTADLLTDKKALMATVADNTAI